MNRSIKSLRRAAELLRHRDLPASRADVDLQMLLDALEARDRHRQQSDRMTH